jgi:glycosyltransferase involved in cell wall biosynthesis
MPTITGSNFTTPTNNPSEVQLPIGSESLERVSSLIEQIDDEGSDSNSPDDYADCEAFSLIIPVYNEVDGVLDTLEAIDQRLNKLAVPYEIVVVDDGSTDGTAEKLKACPFVRVISHGQNRGYGAALKTGIRHSQHSLIVITDGDGSYDNDRIPDMVRLAKQQDMVVGSRTGANVEYSFVRSIPKWFLKRFAQWLSRNPIPDLNSGLRVMRKEVIYRFFNVLPNSFSFTTTITVSMLSNGYRVQYEPINYRRRVGRSKIKPIRDTLRFTQLILRTGMYFAPLRVFMPVAAVFFAGFTASFCRDVFVSKNLADATLILLVASTQLGMFALLADMLDKRSGA